MPYDNCISSYNTSYKDGNTSIKNKIKIKQEHKIQITVQ